MNFGMIVIELIDHFSICFSDVRIVVVLSIYIDLLAALYKMRVGVVYEDIKERDNCNFC